MAVKAGFLPLLKNKGRFSNSGQVFYDNQGTCIFSIHHAAMRVVGITTPCGALP
jgi:hypothetical protein